jgi:hypothetical protein
MAAEHTRPRQSVLDLVHLGRVIFNSLRVMAALGFTNIDVCFVRNHRLNRNCDIQSQPVGLNSCLSRELLLWNSCMTNHPGRL